MVRQESLHCIKADKPYTSILQAKHGCRHTTSSYMLTHKHTVCFFSMKPSQVRSQFSIQRSETKRFVNTRRRETFRHKTNSMKTMKADDVCVYVWLRERGWSKWQTASVEMSRKVLVRCEAVWFADIRRKCKKKRTSLHLSCAVLQDTPSGSLTLARINSSACHDICSSWPCQVHGLPRDVQ